jgi:hypothetical protein
VRRAGPAPSGAYFDACESVKQQTLHLESEDILIYRQKVPTPKGELDAPPCHVHGSKGENKASLAISSDGPTRTLSLHRRCVACQYYGRS